MPSSITLRHSQDSRFSSTMSRPMISTLSSKPSIPMKNTFLLDCQELFSVASSPGPLCIFSSYCLHWLSKVPREVLDSESPAWNKGSIQCDGLKKEVTKAYSAQFQSDMSTFLEARAQEIVGGGLMVIITGGLPDGVIMSQAGIGMYYDLLGSCLIDMAELGVIS
ncbi:hypothetical protein OIU77_001467 [Salix suchowensis]|uniref:Uncharacterized protein n=1 Tax=Salix suchowensis TaxID=1278906 RepID=A0ABQ9B3P5_9ROSI|nr:hypothetical protein OIU77_001467 [Salix suchowensis]